MSDVCYAVNHGNNHLSSPYDVFFRFGLRSDLATVVSCFRFRFACSSFSFTRFFSPLVAGVSSIPSSVPSDSIGSESERGGLGLCARSGFACGTCSGENGSGCMEPTKESI